MSQLEIKFLGCVDYDVAIEQMNSMHQARQKHEIQDAILILEHPAVITRGRKIQDQQLVWQDQLTKMGVQIRNADRGGELTYHGPGQIVVYFILDLNAYAKGISEFVEKLERVLMDFFNVLGVESEIKKDHPGIWVKDKKIASLGLRVSGGITKHGVALNIRNDLAIYQWFHPCGLKGETMTNLEVLLKKSFSDKDYKALQKTLAEHFTQLLQRVV